MYTYCYLSIDIWKAAFRFVLTKHELQIYFAKYNLTISKSAIKNPDVGVQSCTLEMWNILRDASKFCVVVRNTQLLLQNICPSVQEVHYFES